MIIGATGHTGSGKTTFLLGYAMSLGREGIVLTAGVDPASMMSMLPNRNGFKWEVVETNSELPAILDRINRASNIFRADRRVIVIKDVSGYLAACHHLLSDATARIEEYEERMIDYRSKLENAIVSFQGKICIVSNEPASLTPFMSERERCFHKQLAAFNLHMAEQSHVWYWVSSGRAVELRARNKS